MTAAVLNARQMQAETLIGKKRRIVYTVPAIILAYFVFILFAFDIGGLIKRASFDNAATLASDSWSYKTHVTRSHRSGEISCAVKGERKGRCPEGTRPNWVSGAEDIELIDMGGGHEVRLLPGNAMEYGSLVVTNLGDFWNNAMWRHGDVVWAIGETILMAFIGTFGGAIIALPLAFLAAKRFPPFMAIRFAMRRTFDFVRGVDTLIWAFVLSRAFGPGPLTGAPAILLTDTGTFGKIFSEALETVDEKQMEGVASTGAKPSQRYRFGVIPQVVPVLLSQILYFLGSNTRSATIIGAITGGGMGLFIAQAIQTRKDWEEVASYLVLIIIMVILTDWVSGWLRRKLIRRGAD